MIRVLTISLEETINWDLWHYDNIGDNLWKSLHY